MPLRSCATWLICKFSKWADHDVPVPAVFFMTYVLLLVSTKQELQAVCDVTVVPASSPLGQTLVCRSSSCICSAPDVQLTASTLLHDSYLMLGLALRSADIKPVAPC